MPTLGKFFVQAVVPPDDRDAGMLGSIVAESPAGASRRRSELRAPRTVGRRRMDANTRFATFAPVRDLVCLPRTHFALDANSLRQHARHRRESMTLARPSAVGDPRCGTDTLGGILGFLRIDCAPVCVLRGFAPRRRPEDSSGTAETDLPNPTFRIRPATPRLFTPRRLERSRESAFGDDRSERRK